MAIFKIFSVYDSKAQFHMQPKYLNTSAEAMRAFGAVANDPGSQVGQYPADFTLFELGHWNSETAAFDLHSTPISLGLAVEYITPTTRPNGSGGKVSGEPEGRPTLTVITEEKEDS